MIKKQDIIIENDRIKEIGENLDLKYNQKDLKVIDADNLVIAPGFVDVHVHFRDPGLTYKEDIHTGANSAAKREDIQQLYAMGKY
ncbi:hypothetical protein [Lachnobacterium bovis]|uniref:hypothetical protein n=1 Tax=Lachnobacterium bovis TaxID=140626 RepID=UPI00048F6535|nr:hypothetical protein [Lachnobacterium bovis]